VFERKGIKYVGNSGEAGNANALFVMAPREKTAFIVPSNTGYHPFSLSMEKAMDLMLPGKEERVEQLSPENFKELIGTYYRPIIKGTRQGIGHAYFTILSLFAHALGRDDVPVRRSKSHHPFRDCVLP
jgi:hypothetical protein